MFLSELRQFPSAPCLAGKKNLMTSRVSTSLKSRVSLSCFRACFLPGRANDLTAPRYISYDQLTVDVFNSNFGVSLHLFTSRDWLAIDVFAVD